MSIFSSKNTAENWLKTKVNPQTTVQTSKHVIINKDDVIEVKTASRARELAEENYCYAFTVRYNNGVVSSELL
jgi:hypothetical protein